MFAKPALGVPGAVSSGSNPQPSSVTLIAKPPSRASRVTVTREAWACSRTFASASWAMRKRFTLISFEGREWSWSSSR